MPDSLVGPGDTPGSLRTAHGVLKLAHKALLGGATQTSPIVTTWELERNCSKPRHVEHHGRPSYCSVATRRQSLAIERSVIVEMTVPCRQCTECLRRRSFHWTQRIVSELRDAHRNWFGTMTLGNSAHEESRLLATAQAAKAGLDFDAESPESQFRMRHAAITPELTKWLKRCREISGCQLRYCLVAERHKSGLPHYHIVVHEMSQHSPIGERTLREQWRLGFSKWNLVPEGDTKAAYYVCKYLSKDAAARVRASLRYGVTTQNQTYCHSREAINVNEPTHGTNTL